MGSLLPSKSQSPLYKCLGNNMGNSDRETSNYTGKFFNTLVNALF